jgi:hypothetical protein
LLLEDGLWTLQRLVGGGWPPEDENDTRSSCHWSAQLAYAVVVTTTVTTSCHYHHNNNEGRRCFVVAYARRHDRYIVHIVHIIDDEEDDPGDRVGSLESNLERPGASARGLLRHNNGLFFR